MANRDIFPYNLLSKINRLRLVKGKGYIGYRIAHAETEG